MALAKSVDALEEVSVKLKVLVLVRPCGEGLVGRGLWGGRC